MRPVIAINDQFAVTGFLEPEDYKEAARLGFKAIVSNLPDGESPRHPASAQAAQLAAAAGLGFRHIPVTKFDLFSDRVVSATVAAAEELEGPILAHCASGMRSAMAWGAAAALFQSADAVVAALARVGVNAGPLGEEFAQLRLADAGPTPSALKAEA